MSRLSYGRSVESFSFLKILTQSIQFSVDANTIQNTEKIMIGLVMNHGVIQNTNNSDITTIRENNVAVSLKSALLIFDCSTASFRNESPVLVRSDVQIHSIIEIIDYNKE